MATSAESDRRMEVETSLPGETILSSEIEPSLGAASCGREDSSPPAAPPVKKQMQRMTYGSEEVSLRSNLIFLCSITKKVYRLVLTRLKMWRNVFGVPPTEEAEPGPHRPTTRPVHPEETLLLQAPRLYSVYVFRPGFRRVALIAGQESQVGVEIPGWISPTNLPSKSLDERRCFLILNRRGYE